MNPHDPMDGLAVLLIIIFGGMFGGIGLLFGGLYLIGQFCDFLSFLYKYIKNKYNKKIFEQE